MGAKIPRSLADVLRYGMNLSARCECGHATVIDARRLNRRFTARRWPSGCLSLVARQLRCTRCRRRHPRVEGTLVAADAVQRLPW